MNLALQDAAELAEGLLAYYRSGDSARLGAYSSARLARLMNDKPFARAFALAYAGIDP